MIKLDLLRTKIYADGANKDAMLQLARDPRVKGFTTNPSLMREAGITNYESFAREILALIPDRPISLEVFADEIAEMERQAHILASWGEQVYVKIPVANTRRESTSALVRKLSHSGVKVNVTALLTIEQVEEVTSALAGGAPSNASVFAGRIADTGRDPMPFVAQSMKIVREHPSIELIWASTRELLDVVRADDLGCHIITVTPGILKKLSLIGKDLDEYSHETVKMFHHDACASGYQL